MRIMQRISFCSATALLAVATALAQSMPSGGAAPQQPSMPSQPNNPSMSAPGATPGTATTSQQFGDQSFMAEAMARGNAQVELGQLAQQKSQSNDVKQLAQKMASDHSQMNEKWFKPEAKQLGVAEPKGPSKKDKKELAKLQTLSGEQFDTEYIQTMLKENKKGLKDFQDEAQATQDPNVKQIAQQGTTILEQHQQLIEQAAKNHNVPVEGEQKKASM